MRLFPRRSDDDFRSEIDAPVAIETERLIADGLTPEAAAAVSRSGIAGAGRDRAAGVESALADRRLERTRPHPGRSTA
jgi:hypothetical protein